MPNRLIWWDLPKHRVFWKIVHTRNRRLFVLRKSPLIIVGFISIRNIMVYLFTRKGDILRAGRRSRELPLIWNISSIQVISWGRTSSWTHITFKYVLFAKANNNVISSSGKMFYFLFKYFWIRNGKCVCRLHVSVFSVCTLLLLSTMFIQAPFTSIKYIADLSFFE